MAVYSLTNVNFDTKDDGIIAGADILKDGVQLQSFSVSLKRTTSAQELALAVAKYAKNVVIHDTLLSDTFVRAEQLLVAQTWTYG